MCTLLPYSNFGPTTLASLMMECVTCQRLNSTLGHYCNWLNSCLSSENVQDGMWVCWPLQLLITCISAQLKAFKITIRPNYR